ncbi:NifB/NifX family molybdenum-iron cluster-binding protein [Ancylomarina longa]|uniref:Dinitrogenase iron-molybdenum cofactor biosynthesis domain-containing protein n=1 Tax=Ancylomarina longa TaxID=2487017 RepID=A0A434AZH8_9BACT|nr:NifB/NifX family molybdenum-iron cluster-binding protein [Ancylomarina longa]RUT80000.1 hypothetical protein DLK05_01195 [Ancylomarina longa]
MNEILKFAFAVNHSNLFEQKHFGDADKFIIYALNGKEISFVDEVENPYRIFKEEKKHGSQQKGKAIIHLLKDEGVKVFVSRQFGQNIKVINSHFIPVIVSVEEPIEAIEILKRHINWIEDELINKSSDYKLFLMKKGILKTIIKK